MTKKTMGKTSNRAGTLPISARAVAWEILNAYEESKLWVEEELNRRFVNNAFSKKDERLCREITFGVLKMRNYLDYIIRPRLRKNKMPEKKLLNIIRIGIYQIAVLTRVPPHAAVHETVAVAKKKLPLPQVKMINAILRTVTREGIPALPDPRTDTLNYLQVKYSFPAFLVRAWVGQFGREKAERALAAGNQPPKPWVRVNQNAASVRLVQERLAALQVKSEPGVTPTALRLELNHVSPGDVIAAMPKAVYFQDQASQLIGYIVDPKPGQVCLDFCAAPGGKATHLAERMEGTGTVWAHDIHPDKIRRIEENAKRLELKNVSALTVLPKKLEADHVLVDAPCSGLGTLRRHVELRWRIQAGDHARLAKIQLHLLTQAAGYVKVGGRLIYSTCTTAWQENEEVVLAFLKTHPGFAVVPGPGPSGYPDATFWASDGFFRTYPMMDAMDGMFAARLIRRS